SRSDVVLLDWAANLLEADQRIKAVAVAFAFADKPKASRLGRGGLVPSARIELAFRAIASLAVGADIDEQIATEARALVYRQNVQEDEVVVRSMCRLAGGIEWQNV